MQICVCAWIYRWTKNCGKSGLGHLAVQPPGRRAVAGRWAAGLLLEKPSVLVALYSTSSLVVHIKDHYNSQGDLFARILKQNKQTIQVYLCVQSSTDNCYLIAVDNKNSSFIPEKRKSRLNLIRASKDMPKIVIQRKTQL